ncbi:MAG: DUF4351 domain-containing protein, partial [Coprobacillus sp.]
IQEEEGEKIDMCTLTDQIRMVGKQEGLIEGNFEGRIALLTNLLKRRFDSLRQEIIIDIENSSPEQLDSLENHFYEINNQEDISKILTSV